MMRPRKNMLKAGIVALVDHFSEADARQQDNVENILTTAFNWDDDQVVEKLDNYLARINRIDNIYSIVPQSKLELADTLGLDSTLVGDCIDMLKDAEYVVQYGGGYGKLMLMCGETIVLEDLDNFEITLGARQDNRVNPVDEAAYQYMENIADLDNPAEYLRGLSAQFRALAEKLEGWQADALEQKEQEIRELVEANTELRDELDIVKRTSWR